MTPMIADESARSRRHGQSMWSIEAPVVRGIFSYAKFFIGVDSDIKV